MATYTTFDWIELDSIPNGGSPGGFSETYVLAGGPPADGEVIGQFDAVDVTSADTNFGEGDTVDLGGTVYTVINHGYIQSNVTFLSGGVQVVSARIVEIEDGGGAIRTFMIPQDAEGDLPKIVSIEFYSANYSLTSLAVSQIDDDQNVQVICFGEGARIATPNGPRAVEELEIGSLVMTVDCGAQPIRWIARSGHQWNAPPQPNKPILIAAGCLGGGKPDRDLMLSPQHRVLFPGPTCGGGLLGPAKAMTHLPGVRQLAGRRRCTYFHIAFDRHQIVLAEGLPVESFYPGAWALRSLPRADLKTLAKLLACWPKETALSPYPRARPFLSARETRDLLRARRPVWNDALLTEALRGGAPLRSAA